MMLDAATGKRWAAAIRDNDIEAMREMLADGVDVEELVTEETPPLCLAAMFGRLEAAKLLLDAGADVNRTLQPPADPKPGFRYSLDSPLILAAATGNAELVKRLLDRGADLGYCSATRGSALHHAVLSADSKSHLEVIQLLLERGSDPANTADGRNLLCTAARNTKSRGIIPLLVARGANPNRIDECWNATPLHVAIDAGNALALEELLQAGADPGMAAPESRGAWSGLTPLAFAKKQRKKKIEARLEEALAGPQPTGPAGAKGKQAPSKPPTAKASWERLESRLKKEFPAVYKTLNKKATQAQINKLVSSTKIRPNKEAIEFFERHNGQSGEPPLVRLEGETYGYRVLGTDEAIAQWRVWQELNEEGDFADSEAAPDPGVRSCWWSEKWLPLADNGAGDFLCFDFAPAKGGVRGQIIAVYHERPQRPVVFASIRELLAETAEAWEGGQGA